MCAILMEETTGAKLKTKSLEVFIDGQKKRNSIGGALLSAILFNIQWVAGNTS